MQPEHKAKPLDNFTRGYLECALWSSLDELDEPFDYRDIEDFAPEAIEHAREDCDEFQENNADDLAGAGSASQNGHDFWLTRNGHGAGFWDRGYGEVGARLTESAHTYGESNVYTGDGDWLYLA